jgi:hypothetical protein
MSLSYLTFFNGSLTNHTEEAVERNFDSNEPTGQWLMATTCKTMGLDFGCLAPNGSLEKATEDVQFVLI